MPTRKGLNYIWLAVLVVYGSSLVTTARAQDVVMPQPAQSTEAQSADSQNTEATVVQPTGSSSKAGGATSIGPLKLGIIPFFSADDSLDKKSEKTFDDWLKTTANSLQKDAYQDIELQWIKTKKVDQELYSKLPASRIREAAKLLEPLTQNGFDGVLAAWIERKSDGFDLVAVLYLPQRIQLETYQVSANFERLVLEAGTDGFAREPTHKAMRELLQRNLRRITPIQAPAAAPPPTQEKKDEKDSPGETTQPEEIEKVGGDGKPTFAVLNFSKEFSLSGTGEQDYLATIADFDFLVSTQTILEDLIASRVVSASNPASVTYDQIETPVLDLDPNADPLAREKALLSRAGPRVDALIFGHLRQERKKKDLKLYLRCLLRDGYDYLNVEQEISGGSWDETVLQNTLRRALRRLLEEGPWDAHRDNTMQDTVMVKVIPNDSLRKIARRCFGFKKRDKRLPQITATLCKINKLRDCDLITVGADLKVPAAVGQWSRVPTCQ